MSSRNEPSHSKAQILAATAIGSLAIMTGAGVASAQDLLIHHIRVGQGDATLIRSPADASGNRVTVLMDAGDHRGVDGGQLVREVLDRQGITRIDFFIASHYDADHIGGIAAGGPHRSSFAYGPNRVPGAAGDDDGDGVSNWLADENGVVREFFIPDPDEVGLDDDIPIGTYVDYGDVTIDTQVAEKYVALADAGNRVSLDDQADVDGFNIALGQGAQMLALDANGFVRGDTQRVASVDTKNERSLCFVVRFGGFDYLIGGDLTGQPAGQENARVEREVGEFLSNNDIEIDVLRVNHHGADNASEQTFVEDIDPEIAIISVGNGKTHEHPRVPAMERLRQAGVVRIIQTEWGTTDEDIPLDLRPHQAIFFVDQ